MRLAASSIGTSFQAVFNVETGEACDSQIRHLRFGVGSLVRCGFIRSALAHKNMETKQDRTQGQGRPHHLICKVVETERLPPLIIEKHYYRGSNDRVDSISEMKNILIHTSSQVGHCEHQCQTSPPPKRDICKSRRGVGLPGLLFPNMI